MSDKPIVPRPAATLILCRDRSPGIEVLLVQRTHQAVFMPGVFVFPGGAVDALDDLPARDAHLGGLTAAAANALLEVEDGGRGYLVAALRECFEEAGLLLAHTQNPGEQQHDDISALSRPYIRHDHPQWESHGEGFRRQMIEGTASLWEMCDALQLQLPLNRLAYMSRWVTPVGPPRRFDTRFFLAIAPEGQTPAHDGRETIDHLWISPQEAVARNREGALQLSLPTLASLQALEEFTDTEQMMKHFQSPQAHRSRAPRPAIGKAGRRLVQPGEPSYAELAKIDPDCRGLGAYEISPGAPTRLSPTIQRITAPNPGVMTGPGTNSYLIGEGRDRAIIDPGPAIEAHIDALLTAAAGQLRWILVTHTHRDHSPAAVRLKALTGATVLGMPAPGDGHQDQSFAPERTLANGELIRGEGFTLRVLHTPGHASNHLCYLHEAEGVLFSGDHIMQGSTVVINPPDGDMGAFLASLRELRREPLQYIAPGHGFLLDQPNTVIDKLIAHRLKREDKVLAALYSGPAMETDLLALVYDDVPAAIHPVALRSMLAHLYKLRDEGRVSSDGSCWQLSPC